MKGVGHIYQQTFIDTYSRAAICKRYTDKTAITSVDPLNDRVIPFFNEYKIPLLRILTDRGTEYCCTVENHVFQLYLAVEGIDRSKTKAYSPQTNGICERLRKTLKNEFYDIARRQKIYNTADELQSDLNHWLTQYNESRPHSGKFCYGKTPMQTFRESLHIAVSKIIKGPNLTDNIEAA